MKNSNKVKELLKARENARKKVKSGLLSMNDYLDFLKDWENKFLAETNKVKINSNGNVFYYDKDYFNKIKDKEKFTKNIVKNFYLRELQKEIKGGINERNFDQIKGLVKFIRKVENSGVKLTPKQNKIISKISKDLIKKSYENFSLKGTNESELNPDDDYLPIFILSKNKITIDFI